MANFVRCADDRLIAVKSEKKTANRVMESITTFIPKKIRTYSKCRKYKIARLNQIHLGFWIL